MSTRNKGPSKASPKKVAAPLRQSAGAAVEVTTRVPDVHIEADVAALVCEPGAMIDAVRKEVSFIANARSSRSTGKSATASARRCLQNGEPSTAPNCRDNTWPGR